MYKTYFVSYLKQTQGMLTFSDFKSKIVTIDVQFARPDDLLSRIKDAIGNYPAAELTIISLNEINL